jgi:hypothetical protein
MAEAAMAANVSFARAFGSCQPSGDEESTALEKRGLVAAVARRVWPVRLNVSCPDAVSVATRPGPNERERVPPASMDASTDASAVDASAAESAASAPSREASTLFAGAS